ncbi:MAG: CPBP family intramembrane metalloprotease, partial [Chitinispirillaceae bacterium]|nr:CPBP family intramembrane metalloprotease [Chitinispirillaceae bacterium]
WVISGILFALYHTFQIWLLPTLIIATCSMAYITQRTKSIIPSLTVHFVVNFLLGGMGVIMVISK